MNEGMGEVQLIIISRQTIIYLNPPPLVIFFLEVRLGSVGNSFWGRPLLWNHQEISRHSFPESFLVLHWRYDCWRSVLRPPKYAWCLYPGLKVLIPGVLSHEINDPNNQFMLLLIHTNQQGIVHYINRLQQGK